MNMNFAHAAFDTERLIPMHDDLNAVMNHFEPEDASGLHSMVIAGYRVRPSRAYFLLHNSWREAWGDRGYAWEHEKTLEMNVAAAYLVDAEPWDSALGNVPPRQTYLGQCFNGLVNLHGECVVAAPNGYCGDPLTGLAWACAAGGCAHWVPLGALGCTFPWCSMARGFG